MVCGEAGRAVRINGPAAEDCGDLLSDSFHVQTHFQPGQSSLTISFSHCEGAVVFDTFVCDNRDGISDVSGHEVLISECVYCIFVLVASSVCVRVQKMYLCNAGSQVWTSTHCTDESQETNTKTWS